MELDDLKTVVPGFSGLEHYDKIKLFAWYLHTKKNTTHFSSSDIAACYEQLHLSLPSSLSVYLFRLVKDRKELLKSKSGYHLEHKTRDKIETKYGQRQNTVLVTKLLADLPAKVPSLEEREFLKEVIICFKNGAFRAAIIMTWILTFDHLCNYILNHGLSQFNTRWQIAYPGMYAKCPIKAVSKNEDFAEFRESEIIKICSDSRIITGDIRKILEEKLGTRNSAAHPSGTVILQNKAEEFITDLIVNVVLYLKI